MSQTVVSFRPARPTSQRRLAQALRWLAALRREIATRRQLAQLDDRALSDIGISRSQAQFVTERPIWPLYPHFHR